jgi:cathepsin B
MQTVFLALIAVAMAADMAMINKINSVQSLWRASPDSPTANLTPEEKRSLLGTFLTGGPQLPLKTFTAEENMAAPESFDSRTQWPNCSSIQMIRDQSSCGSCWAFGAVEAMSDRECIFNKHDVILSAEDMNSCSKGGSCNGGYPSSAFNYWKSTGVLTEACAPYSLPSCDHHISDSTNPCPTNLYPTPACPSKCTGTSSEFVRHKATSVNSYSGEANMMTEIATNGPLEVSFTVYEDFLTYAGGIYHHVTGASDGGHAVKAIGWGVENGVKYWIIANSWNVHWGEKGFFRIRKGNNECGIENAGYGGVPA